jgi:predicted nucleic acid-binding protein
MMPRPEDDSLTWAILDANIIFKLVNPDDLDSEEALALISDTINPYVRYFVTPELYIETERKANIEEKKRSNDYARTFEKIETKRAPFESFRKLLMPIWKNIDHDRDRSDLNHIAYAAAAGFQNFITQDEGLLEKAEPIYDVCNVTVRRPVEFVTELDQIENLDKYSPRSIARTKYYVSCPTFDDVSSIAEQFCLTHRLEKKKQFEAKIRSAIANKTTYKNISITEEGGARVGFICIKRDLNKSSITIMRHNDNISSKTIVQNFVWGEIFSNTNKNVSLIEFSDSHSLQLNNDLFQAPGFINSRDGWVRISVNDSYSLQDAKDMISSFLDKTKDVSEKVKDGLRSFLSEPSKSASTYEEVFWPLKIRGEGIPTYLIPVRPVWALHLFDAKLAEQELWGADPAKHFNIENVYYRSPKYVNLVPGARILWYVSSSKNKSVSEIRACSRLIEVKTGSAKNLFKEYKRLGIYEWENLMEITGGDPCGKIMALRFYQTEYFNNPIKLSDFFKYGIKGQPFSPRQLVDDQFFNIYADGMKCHEK